MTTEEQRLVAEAVVALRRVENGCRGLPDHALRAFTAGRELAERYEFAQGGTSRVSSLRLVR